MPSTCTDTIGEGSISFSGKSASTSEWAVYVGCWKDWTAALGCEEALTFCAILPSSGGLWFNLDRGVVKYFKVFFQCPCLDFRFLRLFELWFLSRPSVSFLTETPWCLPPSWQGEVSLTSLTLQLWDLLQSSSVDTKPRSFQVLHTASISALPYPELWSPSDLALSFASLLGSPLPMVGPAASCSLLINLSQ